MWKFYRLRRLNEKQKAAKDDIMTIAPGQAMANMELLEDILPY